MRSLIVLGLYCAYLVLGAAGPFVAGLGYVWTDLFSPQNVANDLIVFPASKVMAIATFGFYLLLDRRNPPRPTLGIVLLLLFAVWVTLTTTWAVDPESAWPKWDASVKTLLFAAFLPFLFRSRVQLEALVLTILFALSGTLIAAALKTVAGGGGYGRTLGLLHDQEGPVETSTIAMLAAAVIPLILFLKQHSLIIPRFRHTALAYNLTALAAVLTSFGTFARTGLISLAALGCVLLLQTRRKVGLSIGLFLAGSLSSMLVSPAWLARMSTLETPGADASAGGRLGVWKWTLDFVASHPLGGGFNAYTINSFVIPLPDGTDSVVNGLAFHSMYFEVLGEHGYIGFAIFVLMLALMFFNIGRIRRTTRDIADLKWLYDLMNALRATMIVYLCGGAFVGIAFRSPLYFFMAIVISAGEYCTRATRLRVSAKPAAAPVPHRALADRRAGQQRARRPDPANAR